MEVHAHSHSHGKKNWKQYFWEFLMLFLAVFCGYLFNKATYYYYTYTRLRKQLMEGKAKAADLIDLLNTEYHINK